MNRRVPLLAALLSVAAATAGCLPGRGLPEAESAAESAPDSVAVLVDNGNYLSATVRLFSGGAQVRRISVTGHDSDTVYLRHDQLRVPGEVSAILELVGSREAHRLGEEILPRDATLIEIHVAELLSSSSMSIF